MLLPPAAQREGVLADIDSKRTVSGRSNVDRFGSGQALT